MRNKQTTHWQTLFTFNLNYLCHLKLCQNIMKSLIVCLAVCLCVSAISLFLLLCVKYGVWENDKSVFPNGEEL